MDRITGTAVADLGGGKRGFQDQVLSTGAGSQEGTWVRALWLNAVQEEIMSVIEASGQEPDEGKVTQLLEAIDARIVQAFTNNQNLGARWAKLPGGLTFQWGSVSIPGQGPATWTYPIAFDHDSVMVAATSGTENAEQVYLTSKTKTQAVLDNYPGVADNVAYLLAVGW